MLSIFAKYLTHSITLYPHFEFDRHIDIPKLVEQIKDEFFRRNTNFANNITIYNAKSLYSELYGTDNVVMSWKGERKGLFDDRSKTYTYTYMIIHHMDGKTYGCPLQNEEYIYNSTPYVRFCKITCEEQFLILDEFMKSYPEAKMIELFSIKTDVQLDKCKTYYKELPGIIEANNNKIKKNEERIASLNESCPKSAAINSLMENNERIIKHNKKLTNDCENLKKIISEYEN
jgi:hypothetical protein